MLTIALNTSATSAIAPTKIMPLEQDQFKVISNSIILEPHKPIERRKPKIILVDPIPKIVVKSEPKVANTGRFAFGKASWYCKAGVSICHYKYPAGSMVAAACLKLRNAMGLNWRGKTVKVTYKTKTVYVKLVDWCGSKDKLIDLYWEPMRRLGGTGVLPVKVSW